MNDNPQSSGSVFLMIGKLLLAVSIIVGVIATIMRFRQGLIITNMTQFVPWGFWIVLYIYFIGLSAGSFLLSTLVYVFGVKRFEAVGPLALLQALICMMLGLTLVFIDLGHPFRFLNVFIHFNVTSVLAWESLAYMLYIAIILAELHYAISGNRGGESIRQKSKQMLKTLGIIGIPIAIAVHGGTGAIFAVIKSRPTWYTGLFPILFLVSALVSGGAGLTFLTAFALPLEKAKKLPLLKALATMVVGFVALDLLFISSEILVAFYGGIPSHIQAWKVTLFGPFWWAFWIFQIGMGAVFPIVVIVYSKTRDSIGWLGMSGFFVMLGIVCVRFNIVIPPQLKPEFSSIPDVYHHLRYTTGYFPSMNEMLVALGITAFGMGIFFWVLKLLKFSIIPENNISEGEV